MMKPPVSAPILSCAEAGQWEAVYFGGDEAKEWPAMQSAGRAIARAVGCDFAEIGGFKPDGRVLVVTGKGHNGGDALIAVQALLEQYPAARAEVIFAFGERALRPLAARAWRDLSQAAGARVALISPEALGASYELCLDGVFGFQFRPPADEATTALIQRVNACAVRLRAAVDLPSADLFKADFTYATGILKTPLLHSSTAGRLRFLDLGFFRKDNCAQVPLRLLTPEVLAPLAALRDGQSDKRTYGHVCVLGGSRSYPGAVMMTVLAALRSGAGLVTAFVPESLAAVYAAQVPEAMWVAWPETHDGSLALEGHHLLKALWSRLDALVIGPGLGREPETLALVEEIVKTSPIPVVLDADALKSQIVRAAKCPLVLTPHAGEFKRIAGDSDGSSFARETGATVVLKGPVTRISGGEGYVYHSAFGGPALARGGSGDLLAGLIGTQLAQNPEDPLLAACRGTVWHGLAADALARANGSVAIRTTQVLDFLGTVLRESSHER